MFDRLGDATDVVTKEMYDFVDQGDRHVALRPEQTASVCRAFVQHRPPTPWKVWYAGPNFRYEKPQRGRYRQFDQVGVEVLGADDPYLDVEVIALGWEFYRRLGLRQVTLLSTRSASRTTGPATSTRCARTSTRTPATLVGREPDHARQEPAAGPRLQARAGRAAHRGRAADRRLLQRRRGRPLRRGAAGARPTSASRSPSTRRSSAASTTTGARRSSTRAARSTRRRTRSAAAAATTAWSRRSAARRRTASGSRSASTARCSPATTRACSPPPTPASRCSSSTPRAASRRSRITAELRDAGISADRAFENRSMKSQMKAADRSGAQVADHRRHQRARAGRRSSCARCAATDEQSRGRRRTDLIDCSEEGRSHDSRTEHARP